MVYGDSGPARRGRLGGQGRRGRCVLLVLVAALGLIGCADDPVRPPDPLPPTSAATTEPPAPTASSGPNGIVPIPTPGARASEYSEVGAIVFNEYWVMTLDFLYATLDVEPFRAVSSPECSFCTYVIDLHGPRRDQGYIYQGGRLTITGSVVNQFEGSSATVTTIVSVTELAITDPLGNRDPESGPAYPRYQLVNLLRWTGDGWSVLDSNGGVL